MSYKEHVLEVFKEHLNCTGYSSEEINELAENTQYNVIEKWLIQIGYNLNEYYLMKA